MARTTTLQIRLSDAEKAEITKQAQATGLGISAYVRSRVLDGAALEEDPPGASGAQPESVVAGALEPDWGELERNPTFRSRVNQLIVKDRSIRDRDVARRRVYEDWEV